LTLTLEAHEVFSDYHEPVALLQRALMEFAPSNPFRKDRPHVSYRISVTDLWKLTNAEPKELNIGDYALVYDEQLGFDARVRVAALEIYPLEPKRSVITLGDPPRTVRDVLSDMVRVNSPFYHPALPPFELPELELPDFDLEKIIKELTTVLEADNVITSHVFADSGLIMNAIVRRLRTDLNKPWLYLAGDTRDVHYQDIGDTPNASGRYFNVAMAQTALPPVQFAVPSIDGVAAEVPLYWFRGIPGGRITTIPAASLPEGYTPPEESAEEIEPPYSPVMVYQYKTETRHSHELFRTPEGWWGVEERYGIGEDAHARGQGVIQRTGQYFQFVQNPGNGEEIGGVRISSQDGVQLFNPRTKIWEYPGGSNLIISVAERAALTQSQINALPEDALIFVYDINGGGF